MRRGGDPAVLSPEYACFACRTRMHPFSPAQQGGSDELLRGSGGYFGICRFDDCMCHLLHTRNMRARRRWPRRECSFRGLGP